MLNTKKAFSGFSVNDIPGSFGTDEITPDHQDRRS
jgi:hypothetical protein